MIDTSPAKPLVPIPHARLRQPDVERATGPRARRPIVRRLVVCALVVLAWTMAACALYLVSTGFAAIPDGPGDTGLPLAPR